MAVNTRLVLYPILIFLGAVDCIAEIGPTTPVGLMLNPAGSRLTRAGSTSPAAAKAGDLLYAGDVVHAGAEAASFLYCPGKSALTLAPSTEILIQESELTINSGRLDSKRRVMSCFLPPEVRLAVASRQTYGVLVSRGEEEGQWDPTPRDKWPAGLAQEMKAVELAIAVLNDAPSLLSRAALYEKYGLLPEAVNDYRELTRVWSEASWISGKIADLKRAMALPRAPRQNYSGMK